MSSVNARDNSFLPVCKQVEISVRKEKKIRFRVPENRHISYYARNSHA
jgi:hypothetical protein